MLEARSPASPVDPRIPTYSLHPRFLVQAPLLQTLAAGRGKLGTTKRWNGPLFQPCHARARKKEGTQRQAGRFSGAAEAQFRIQPFIMERKRAWLGAIPRAGSACGSLRLDPGAPSAAKAAS